MKALRASLAACLVLGVLATGCGSEKPSVAERRNACLYEAARTYPDWSPGQPRVTESLPQCKGLSEADRQEIRTIMAEFTSAANRNAGGQ